MMKKKELINRIVLILCIIVGLCCLLRLLWPSSKQVATRTYCMNNLVQIGKMSVWYAMDYGDNYPSNLQSITHIMNCPRIFRCPSRGGKPGALTNVDEWSDYVLIPNIRGDDPPDTVLAFCRPENHGGKGTHVLDAGGGVEWYNMQDFIALTNNPVLFRWRAEKK